jgi:predicted nucleic acid-binding protein
VKVRDALDGVHRLFLDSAPVIYYVEHDEQRIAVLDEVFDRVRSGALIAVTGPVTLAECLVLPYRLGDVVLQQDFFDLVVRGANTTFSTIDHERARDAAELRGRYNLTLADALQIACAIRAGCEAFLTNDDRLRRVTEVRVLVLDELEV